MKKQTENIKPYPVDLKRLFEKTSVLVVQKLELGDSSKVRLPFSGPVEEQIQMPLSKIEPREITRLENKIQIGNVKNLFKVKKGKAVIVYAAPLYCFGFINEHLDLFAKLEYIGHNHIRCHQLWDFDAELEEEEGLKRWLKGLEKNV